MDKSGDSTQHKLDYASWKQLARLDSIEYYKFTYPEGVYRFEYPAPDSLTQFAPYVMQGGAQQPVHVIYVDNAPVYFSWSTNVRPYSFAVDSGYHQVKLRTTSQEIIIDSIYFNHGQKLILSLSDTLKHPHVRFSNALPYLSSIEKKVLHKYIFPYRNNFQKHHAFIEQEDGLFYSLVPLQNKGRFQMAGPVPMLQTTFSQVDSFSLSFGHEPGFEYDFAVGLLKMREVPKENYPESLKWYKNQTQSLSDVVLTKARFMEQWQQHLDALRLSTARYTYPRKTSSGHGSLVLNIKGELPPPLNMMLFRYDNHEFIRVYPGQTHLMHELEEGHYRLLIMYLGAQYSSADSVYVQRNGSNYFSMPQNSTLMMPDTFSIGISRLIEKTIYTPRPFTKNAAHEARKMQQFYRQQFSYTGEGRVVSGYVYEKEENNPLPGVTVVLKGTNFGTLTDIDGYYMLKVPYGRHELIFNFVGYVSENVAIDSDRINVRMSPDLKMLQEVVVTGYGQQSRSLTGSIAVVGASNSYTLNEVEGIPADQLAGMAAGVLIKEKEGITVRIRGQSAIEFKNQPLYIINGAIYTGDITQLNPALFQHIEVLRPDDAIATYGSMAASGVILINVSEEAMKSIAINGVEDTPEQEAPTQDMQGYNSIRKNFSDYAFWQPRLRTDKKGVASFETTFPDDITQWETFYLAMNKGRQAGRASGGIKSYRPLMAQLSLPRFLVQGDTSFAIGKVLNYTPPTPSV